MPFSNRLGTVSIWAYCARYMGRLICLTVRCANQTTYLAIRINILYSRMQCYTWLDYCLRSSQDIFVIICICNSTVNDIDYLYREFRIVCNVNKCKNSKLFDVCYKKRYIVWNHATRGGIKRASHYRAGNTYRALISSQKLFFPLDGRTDRLWGFPSRQTRATPEWLAASNIFRTVCIHGNAFYCMHTYTLLSAYRRTFGVR